MSVRLWYPILWRAAAVWLPIAVASTGLAGLVYSAVQQDLRQSANDPQIQLAEDAAARLDAGAAPLAVVPPDAVPLERSLAPYLMVFDASGRPLASSASLGGAMPPFPSTVFEAVRLAGQDRITWQPATGVRSAVVVQPWQGGFVVAGRSLRLVEERENHILLLVIAGWLATLGGSGLAALLGGVLLASPLRPVPWRALLLASHGRLPGPAVRAPNSAA